MSDFIFETANIFYLSTRIHRYATTGHYVTFSNLSKKGLQWPRICQLSSGHQAGIWYRALVTQLIEFILCPIFLFRECASTDLKLRVIWWLEGIYIKQGFWLRSQFYFYGPKLFLSLFLYRNRSSWIPSPEVGSGGLWDGEAGPKCAWLDHRYRRFIRYFSLFY